MSFFFFFFLFASPWPVSILSLGSLGWKSMRPSFLSLGSHMACELRMGHLSLGSSCSLPESCSKSPGKALGPVLGFWALSDWIGITVLNGENCIHILASLTLASREHRIMSFIWHWTGNNLSCYLPVWEQLYFFTIVKRIQAYWKILDHTEIKR